MFAEVTGGKLVEGALLPSPPSWIGLRSVTIKQGWVGFYYLQQLRNTYVFYTWHFPMMYVLSPWHYLHNLCSKWSCSKWFRYIPVAMQPIPIVSLTFIWRFWKGINSPKDYLLQDQFLCVLIFGNFVVYRQIWENLSASNLLYFPTHANKSIQNFCWVCYIA